MQQVAAFCPSPTAFSDRARRIRVVIACTFDPLGLQGPLQVWLRQLTGLPCDISWIGYGMASDAMLDGASAWGANSSGVNVLLLRWADLRRMGARQADPPSELLRALRSSCASRRLPTVVLLPPSSAVEDEPDEELTQALRSIDGVQLIGSSSLRAAFGALRYHSPFLDRVAHAPYSPSGCSVLASIICREVARAAAPKRKGYLLDCDNTLWGGAVGELGPHGVRMSEPFLSVQRRFVDRQRCGSLLCLVSRNLPNDVRAVLRERAEEMVLKDEHVVALRAGWGAKSDSVLELANTLCLDPSSLVFVDDSPAECAEVTTRAHPRGVGVVHIPREPSRIGAYLDCCWTLDEPPSTSAASEGAGDGAATTAEDRKRTALYRELDERKSFASAAAASATASVSASSSSAAASVDAFVASLNLRVEFAALDAESALRAAQLTDRTNQHNACKWPISADRLTRATAGCTCTAVSASDRFGDHGLIGLIVLDLKPTHASAVDPQPDVLDITSGDTASADACCVLHVRNWLLSCRSLHLGIEHMMLRHAAAVAAERGATHLGVHWVRAERNEPAAAFLFSLPGVAFVPVADATRLGLQPLERAVMIDGDDELSDASTLGKPAATESTDAIANPSPITLPADATPDEAVAALESSFRSAMEAGRAPRLSELPAADELSSLLPATERKLLVRRLLATAARARVGELTSSSKRAELSLLIRGRIGGEMCRHAVGGTLCTRDGCPFVHINANKSAAGELSSAASDAPPTPAIARTPPTAPKHPDPTYGQVSQYRKDTIRPEAGVILIPLDAAKAAAVSFKPLSAAPAAPPPVQPSSKAEASAEGVPIDYARPGFESSSSVGLHPETVHSLAEALSTDGGKALHEWVAAESARVHKLPEAFAEAWAMYERRSELLERADADSTTRAPDGEADGEADEMGALDVEALGARLRRRMRHSMHLMMQEANPESYYSTVRHLEPT